MLQRRPGRVIVSCGIRIDYDGKLVDRVLPRRRSTCATCCATGSPSCTPPRSSCAAPPSSTVSASSTRRSRVVRRGLRVPAARVAGRAVRTVPRVGVVVRWHKQSYFTSRWDTMAQGLTWLLERYPEFATVPAGEARVAGQVAFATRRRATAATRCAGSGARSGTTRSSRGRTSPSRSPGCRPGRRDRPPPARPRPRHLARTLRDRGTAPLAGVVLAARHTSGRTAGPDPAEVRTRPRRCTCATLLR